MQTHLKCATLSKLSFEYLEIFNELFRFSAVSAGEVKT